MPLKKIEDFEKDGNLKALLQFFFLCFCRFNGDFLVHDGGKNQLQNYTVNAIHKTLLKKQLRKYGMMPDSEKACGLWVFDWKRWDVA